jgi:hypothetical protein
VRQAAEVVLLEDHDPEPLGCGTILM